ncbi:retinitis pigmentosa 1-like 1 protein [Nematolebias whitei]|uniref:retinitis pigmentosa 1-like 1 protein n=1 Tax=Nematolebias whitei TaxID=451745 RepID=UPI001896CADF|nr:retinitis pigmentosa 1-like 1 protein [Nematolebias whitei]
MHSDQTGLWDPQPPSKHATPFPAPPPSNPRISYVTSAIPAKRITFYKSGDSQFGGVRMAIHKRSFKCFDALLDDLSQKVPLPFGVRTVTTPQGRHTIKHLEQLQDGGCYLCSDQRQAKPINMELASKRQGVWYHQSRRPLRPESSSATPPGHLHLLYRQRQILLVKNSEPVIRRSIVLSRRSTRSLKAFLDEASEVMQFHVRKLYTAEGRRIDRVQSLMTCPAVLVCVGRESFSPMLINFIRKSSEEKLPGLGCQPPGPGTRVPGNGARSPSTQGVRSPPHGAQSRSSEYDEGHDNKKNNNFGLETKKSIIHPRSDSSNRSTRFSVSSEKSYGLGSQSRPSIMNDDIEKRVLVNKDGSLSVEMRVRFRLQNEETIQWSTQIKKSPSLTNDCCPLSQTQPHYLQQSQSESCSDPDSTSYEGMDYSSQPLIQALAEKHCPRCFQSQNNQFDLWENSTKKHHPVPPTHAPNQTMMRHTRSSSSSSSCNSRRMVRCRARLSRSSGGSGSEQGQFVQKEMSVMERVEHRVEVDQDGDTQVEVCKVSRCCSRTEVVAMDTDLLPQSTKIVEGELMIEQDENRPLSAVSSSSHVLQSLKEDQDDDDDEDRLPLSASQCSNRTERPPSPTLVAHLDKEPASNISDNSVCSVKQKDHKENDETESRVLFAASTCHCGAADESDRVPSSKSNISKPRSEEEGAADNEVEDINRAASGLSRHTGRSESSQKSWTSDVCSNCGGWKHGPVFAVPNPLEVRAPSVISTTSNPNSRGKDEGRLPSSTSSTSRRSNMTHKSECKGISGVAAEKDDERSPSTMSAQCNLFPMYAKSKCTAEAVVIKLREDEEEETTAERTGSSLSDKSSTSVKFRKTNFPQSTKEALLSDKVAEEGDTEKRAPSMLSVRSNASAKSGKAESLLSNKSTKSNVSTKSGTSQGSTYSSQYGKVFSQSLKMTANAEENENKNTEEVQSRPESMLSNNSKSDTRASARSDKSAKSHINIEADRSPSAVSDRLHCSAKSSKSHKSNRTHKSPNQQDSDVTMTKTDGDAMENKIDLESVMSVKSKTSVKSGASHKSNSSSNFTSPNIAIIKTPESPNEEENNTKECELSVASAKSSIALHNPSNNKMADIAVIKTVEAGENVNNSAPGCKSTEDSHSQSLSPRRRPSSRTQSSKSTSPEHSQPQQFLPKPDGGELRLHSTTSSKGSFKCCCGVVSALEHEDKRKGENQEDEKYDGASERAYSILSSKRRRKKSGSTEIPLSCNSSGSISLGLQENQEMGDSDSGKSGVSFHSQAEGKITGSVKTATLNVCKNPENSSVKEDVRSESTVSDGETEITAAHPPAVDIPTITTPTESNDGNKESGEQTTERAASANSVKSNRSHKSCCNSVKAAAQTLDGMSEEKSASTGSTKNPNIEETESVKSTSTTNASKTDTLSNRTSSAVSGNAMVRKKSPSRAGVKNITKGTTGFSSNTDAENWDTSIPPSEINKMEDIPQNKSIYSQSPSKHRPESTASAQSESRKSSKPCKVNHESVKSDLCPVKSHKTKSLTGSEGGSNRVPNSKKETSIKSSSPCPIHNPRPSSKTEVGVESSPSGGDLLRETRPVEYQHSHHSKSSKTNGKPQSAKSGGSQKSRHMKDQEGVGELTLKCLPNKSPNEVVSDWLQSIPANSNILALNNDLNEEEDDQRTKQMVETPGQEIGATEISPDEEKDGNNDNVEPQEEEDKEHKVDCEAEGPTLGDSVRTSPHSKNWQCSAAVMKVLLSSSPGRCRSMPEVSPVYGRRLSTSARGLLDSLTQLQLIEPAVGCGSYQQKEHKQQYEEIMAILQSLWLTEPRDIEALETKDYRCSKQVTPPRSSSGVGMSSGSDGSGKGNGNQGEDETCAKAEEAVEKANKIGNIIEMEREETFKEDTSRKSEDQTTVPQSLESPKTTENTSSSEKNTTNDGFKFPTDNKRETEEDSHSRAPLSKRLSQDPDPVWVLHLLNKLEKQFMSHYIQTMAEFKVRWDLADSLLLDTMISELRDEVSRRIQSSIQREMKKIQSRAGKVGVSPRPPQLASISRDSTMTEKRRRIMKVMKNQSVKTTDCVSDEEMTGSDQRSDDEYCPCDACVRKKMATRPLKQNSLAAECPILMEFDLRKILQLKKSPVPANVAAPQPTKEEEEEARNLEMVEEEEEEEETKEDIEAKVVLEETIPEEEEEEEQEKNKSEEGGEKVGNSVEDEEQDEGETSEQEETSENGEEEEGGCTCLSAKEEEESKEEETSNCTDDETGEETGDDEKGGNEGETTTGEEEEESDKETVKEATPDNQSGDDASAQNDANEESVQVEEAEKENISSEAEDEDDEDDGTGEEEPHEEETESESEEQDEEASEEERTSPQSQGETPSVTEGEEADVEDSDDSKLDTSTEESGHEEGAGSREEEDSKDNDEDIVKEFRPEEMSEEEEEAKNEDGTLLHQFTKTSVESQPGSMEDENTDLTSSPVESTKAPEVAANVSAGGLTDHRSSQSNVKQGKAKKDIKN